MKYEEVFSVGFDRSYGGCDFSVRCQKTKLTRKQFDDLVSMTYYALSQLEHMVETKEDLCCEEEQKWIKT